MSSYKVKDARESRIDPVPEGVHVAVCYGIYFIGHQPTEWKGKSKLTEKVVIAWEIPSERIELGEKGVERYGKANMPRAISSIYTASLGSKANLRRDLEAWRGKRFTEEELQGFEMDKLLGKACQISVAHNTRDGKTFASVVGVMALPKGMKAPEPENATKVWSIAEDDSEDENVPEWVRKKAKESDEFIKMMNPTAEDSHENDMTQDDPPSAAAEEEDELPF